jgi:SAM-dependent methyltransferase
VSAGIFGSSSVQVVPGGLAGFVASRMDSEIRVPGGRRVHLNGLDARNLHFAGLALPKCGNICCNDAGECRLNKPVIPWMSVYKRYDMKSLPDFNDDNPLHDKNTPLRQADVDRLTTCEPILLRLLEQTATRLKKPSSELRVLDFGCGKGRMVARLHQDGYDGYGVEVNPLYVNNGSLYLEDKYARANLISLLDEEGHSHFPDGFFDVVYSNQVFEHVQNLGPVLRETGRLMAPSALALHIFPSAHCLVEPHMLLPLVHWLPKGHTLQAAIHVLLALGFGAPCFNEFSNRDRAAIFSKFSETDTFYRTRGELARLFSEYGFKLRNVEREKLMCRGGLAARVAGSFGVGTLGAWAYREFYQTYLLASKNDAIFHFKA